MEALPRSSEWFVVEVGEGECNYTTVLSSPEYRKPESSESEGRVGTLIIIISGGHK